MNRKILTLAAALAVAAPAMMVAPAAFAQSAPTQTVAAAPALTTITRDNIEAEILKSDKPALVLVTSPNCSSCASTSSALAAQAAKHPEWKFAQADAADLGSIPAEATPFITIVVPGVGQTYSKENFVEPADMDAFIAKRVEVVGKITAEQKRLEALKAEIATKSKPFTDEMADLQAQANTLAKPFQDRLAAVAADQKKALEPLQKELADVHARRNAVDKPFDDQVKEIAARREAATADLNTEWQALTKQVREARRSGVKADDPSLKEPMARITAIEAEYDVKAKPFNDEIKAVSDKADAARKPFYAEEDAVEAKIDAATAPFNTQRQQIRAEGTEAIKDLRAKALDVQKRQAAALGTLPDEAGAVEDRIYELVNGPDSK
jgi:hypothetical protein